MDAVKKLSEISALRGEEEFLRAALEEIAKQKLSSQLIPGDADFETGYDCCVKTARKALNPDD